MLYADICIMPAQFPLKVKRRNSYSLINFFKKFLKDELIKPILTLSSVDYALKC